MSYKDSTRLDPIAENKLINQMKKAFANRRAFQPRFRISRPWLDTLNWEKQKRIEDCWQGEDIDLQQFDTFNYSVTRGRALFDTHLKENEPAFIVTERAYRNKLALDRKQRGIP